MSTQLEDLLDAGDLVAARQWLEAHSAVEVAEHFGWLSAEEQAIAFRLLPKNQALRVFEFMDTPHQVDLLEALRSERVTEIFSDLAVDDVARILEEMPAKVATRMLAGLEPSMRTAAATLLGYPEDSVGRRMVPIATVLSPKLTRDEALHKLQVRGNTHDASFAMVPVTDSERTLLGMVSLGDLITAPDGTRVDEIFSPEQHTATAYTDQEDAARLVQEADLWVLPIVDDEFRLLGLLTVDDAMEILESEATEDAYRSGGAEPLNEPYLYATVLTLAKKRGVWLVVLILAAFLTINVMQYFEATLEAVVVLSVFVPMVIGTGGNAGSQAASSVVRALAVNEVRPRDIFRVIWREVRVGLLLGAFLGLLLIPIISWLYYFQVALTIAITVVFICAWACIVGGVLPLVAKKIGVDPAVFSTPVVSTLVDATGLIIYFTVAGMIMSDQIQAALGV